MAGKNLDDTEPRVQRLVESHSPKGLWAERLADTGLCVSGQQKGNKQMSEGDETRELYQKNARKEQQTKHRKKIISLLGALVYLILSFIGFVMILTLYRGSVSAGSRKIVLLLTLLSVGIFWLMYWRKQRHSKKEREANEKNDAEKATRPILSGSPRIKFNTQVKWALAITLILAIAVFIYLKQYRLAYCGARYIQQKQTRFSDLIPSCFDRPLYKFIW